MSGLMAVSVAAHVLKVFQGLSEKQDVPPNLVVVFAEIAQNPGRSLTAYGASVGLGQAVMSRSVEALSKDYGLVEKETDPSNLSRKVVRLTAGGKALLNSIAGDVQKMTKTR